MNVDYSLLTNQTGNVMLPNIQERAISVALVVINAFLGDITWQIILKLTREKNRMPVAYVERLLLLDPIIIVIYELTLLENLLIQKFK